jgi:plastocyanin
MIMLSLDARTRWLRAVSAAGLGLAIVLVTTACSSNVSAQTAPAGAGSAGSSGAQSFAVQMNDANQFVPQSITVPRGATVTWTNIGKDAVPHTATGDPSLAINAADVSLPAGAQPWGSDALGPNQSYSHTFDVPGTYQYVCRYHEVLGMVGTLTVTP